MVFKGDGNMSELDIAILAPMDERVPPLKYGGIERVVDGLTTALAKLGHRVTLYASGDSVVPEGVELVPCTESAVRLRREAEDKVTRSALSAFGLAEAIKHMRDQQKQGRVFDIIHNHFGPEYLSVRDLMLNEIQAPRLTTFHGPLYGMQYQTFFTKGGFLGNEPVVNISKNQKTHLPGANYVSLVYNGVDTEKLQFNPKNRDKLAFIGRSHKDKGIDDAIEIAAGAERNLIIAAKVDQNDRDWHESEVEPLLKRYKGLVEFYGEADDTEKSEILDDCDLLAPLNWAEPFGLVYAEALAKGSASVARPLGAVPEIVKNGKTGILSRTNKELIRRIRSGELERIDRTLCRQDAEDIFSYDVMTSGYLGAYGVVLARH